MRLNYFAVVLGLLVAVSLDACSSSSTAPPPPPAPQNLYAVDLSTKKIFVYSLPASAASVPAVTVTTGFNPLYGAAFDASGTFWVDKDTNPSVLHGYTLPLTAASVPVSNVTTNRNGPNQYG